MTAEPLSATGSPPGRQNTVEPTDQAREVLRLFDAKAAGWAAKYTQDGPLVGRLATLFAAVSLYARARDEVLDLGCGTGELVRALTAAGLRATGCDISPQMLLRAARHPEARDPGRNAGWVRLAPDWRRLPFASGAFDVVVAASVFEYVAEPAPVLRECARVLRPGGVLLCTVPDLRHPVRWAEWLAQRLAAATGAPSGNGRQEWWNEYRAYLRTSRQRHRIRWWLAASGLANLHPVPCPADGARSSLRLLAFRRSGGTITPSASTAGEWR